MNYKKTILKLLHQSVPSFLYKKNAYSQDGEDMVIASFYEGIKNYKGFYIDIGAHHPYRFSNTAYFYNKGWKGINIEPTPDLFKPFLKYRKKDININVGIGNGEKMTFYVFNEGALNTFDKELATQRNDDISNNYQITHTIEIQTKTIAEICEKYINQNQKIDFLTIDVEGLDFEVLKTNDWTKYLPKYILVECEFTISDIKNDQIYQYLTERGYEMVARTKRTSIFHLI